MVVMTRVEICFLSLQEVSFLYFLGMGNDNGIHASGFVLYSVRIFIPKPNRIGFQVSVTQIQSDPKP
uniref:Uncharacterized protein n=1 Tax=Populus trichocarpa TaxID=3694 RepID=A0A2K1YC91_POPTR